MFSFIETEDEKETMRMIKVSNIPDGTSEDAFRFFFENKRKSGGGDIEELDYDEESHMAIITFEEDDVAERVMNKNPLLFEKKIINVEIYKPETQDIEEDRQSTGDQEVADKPSDIAIGVRGMKPTTSKDTLMYYFEGRKGANADVVKMEFIEEKEMYMIWFEEEEAIETVLKKLHKVDGKMLEVKKYEPPPPPKPVPKYDNKVFITNMSSVTTTDRLENFLEAKSKISTQKVIFGETEGSALVTFEEIPDIEKLQKTCTMRPLDGSHLKIHMVAITDCIVVSGFNANTSTDLLENYFDNKGRSGVEGVRDVVMKRDEGQCLVYFSDPNSALEVCKKEHKFAGDILKVQVYYECLGQAAEDDDGPKFKQLKPTLLKNLDPRKIEFILHSQPNKTAFEKQLSSHYAVVVWPDLKEIKDTLEVSCTLTEEVKDYRKLAKTWAKTVTTDAEKFFVMLEVIKLEILQGEWDEVIKQLHDISIANPENVAIRVAKEQHMILVIGHKIPADELAKIVKSIIAKSEIQLKLQSAEMRLLQEEYQTEIDSIKNKIMKDHVTMKLDNIMGVCIDGNAKGVVDKDMASPEYTFCNVCETQSNTNAAVKWCFECEEALCTECLKYHSSSKFTRSHTPIDIENYRSLPSYVLEIKQYCDEHGEKFQNYCKSHDCPCCSTCIGSSHRKCNPLPSLHDVVQNARTSTALTDIEERLENLKRFFAKLCTEKEINISDLKLEKESILAQIKQIRNTLNQRLDRLEKDIIQRLSKIESTHRIRMEKMCTDLKKNENNANELQDSIAKMKKFASDLQIFLGRRNLEAEVMKKEKMIEEIPTDETLTTQHIVFQENAVLATLQSSLNSLGELSVVTRPSNIRKGTPKVDQAQINTTRINNFDNLNLVIRQNIDVDINYIYMDAL